MKSLPWSDLHIMCNPVKRVLSHIYLLFSGNNGSASKAVSTPVPVTNRTLAYWALESGLRPHELKIDRPRTVRAQLN